MLPLEPFSKDQGRSAVQPIKGIPPLSFLAPSRFPHLLTRTHVRLLGPCFKTGRMGSPLAGATGTQVLYNSPPQRRVPQFLGRNDNVPRAGSTARASAAVAAGTEPRPEPSAGPAINRSGYDRGASPAPIRFPPGNFKHYLTLFSKSFSSFPRGTCSLSVSHLYLALDGIYRPIRAAFPNNPTR